MKITKEFWDDYMTEKKRHREYFSEKLYKQHDKLSMLYFDRDYHASHLRLVEKKIKELEEMK